MSDKNHNGKKYLHPEKYREFGLTVGLCSCVQENDGVPDKRCEYCYGTGIFVYTNVEVPAPSNCPHWVKDDIYVKGFRCSLYRDTHPHTTIPTEKQRPPCEECIYQSQSADHDNAIKKKTIEEIMLWRKENRGKKLGYCTSGMIEDQFLTELIDKDSWSIEEHDANIAAQATAEVNRRVLQNLKKDLESRFIPSSNQWSKGRNSGLLECCNIIDESLRLAQPEPTEKLK